VLEKYTFKNDSEANQFFHDNPYLFLVKFVVNGNLQHYIITRDRKLGDRVHMKTDSITPSGGGVRND